MNPLVAIVTLAALLFYLATGIAVARSRRKNGVAAPAMTGNPDFERAVRVQANTLEWLVVFLPALWLFAAYVSPVVAAGLGVVWIAGRILYMAGYLKAADQRGLGFGIQGLAAAVLLLGGLGGAVMALIRPG